MQPETLPEIKSRPVYQPVRKNERARCHIFVVAAEMPEAMAEIYASCDASQSKLIRVDDVALAKQEISNIIPELPLSTTVYVAGPEAFIWKISDMFTSAGMMQEQIQLFSPDEKSRQVFCCHCYHITDAVTQSPAECEGCKRLLVVTDHFARKHGAYFGYQVNAEDPKDVPAAEELS